MAEKLSTLLTGDRAEEAHHGPNLAFLLSWVCQPQKSKGLNSRQTRNNAPVIKFETKIQQTHLFAARKQIAFSFLSHFFLPKQNILLWNMSNLQYLLSLYLITGKGLQDFCWFLHFLLKFLRGFWGNLISKKGGGKKNLICIPQALLMEETCCLFKSIFWWEKANHHVFHSLPVNLLLDCASFSAVSRALNSLFQAFCPRRWSWGLCPTATLGGKLTLIEHPQLSCLHPQSHFTSNQPSWQRLVGRWGNWG